VDYNIGLTADLGNIDKRFVGFSRLKTISTDGVLRQTVRFADILDDGFDQK